MRTTFSKLLRKARLYKNVCSLHQLHISAILYFLSRADDSNGSYLLVLGLTMRSINYILDAS